MVAGGNNPAATFLRASTGELIVKATADNLVESIQQAALSGDTVEIPPGVYECCIDLPEGSRGMRLVGAGRNRTFIRSNQPGVPALRARGLWYSEIRGICFETQYANESGGVLEIDGGPLHGVQGNTYADLTIDGRSKTGDGKLSEFAMTMCKNAGSSGQGSEQCFHNCHFVGAARACYLQHGYNALNNQFFGGNFQLYDRNAIEVIFGSVHLYGVGFQSCSGIRQVKNDGWDIRADSGGVADALIISGCRSESLRFIKGCGAQPPTIIGCNQRPAIQSFNEWTEYKVGDCVMQVDGKTGLGTLHRCTTDHVGNGFSVFNWQPVDFDCVDVYESVIINSYFQCGTVNQRIDKLSSNVEINDDYDIPPRGVDTIFVDASKKSIAINLPPEGSVSHGKLIEIVRGDQNTKTSVTIRGMYLNNTNAFWYTLNTSNKRAMRFRAMGGGRLTRRWYVA